MLRGGTPDTEDRSSRRCTWKARVHDGQQPGAPCPQDQVNRQFHADRPHQLWVFDFTYVSA